MFRQFFNRDKAEKRAKDLLKISAFGTPLRERAIVKHRQFWPKTPYTSEDDTHEAGFIHGYASREEEVLSLKSEIDYLRTLTQDIEQNNSVHFIKGESSWLKN